MALLKDFLFTLRAERDELYEALKDECDRQALDNATRGDLVLFEMRYLHQYGWRTAEHESFHFICNKIKEREARLYDETMKGVAA